MTILEAHGRGLQVLAASRNLPREEAHARARLLLDFVAGRRYAHLMSPAQVLEPRQAQAFERALERAARGEPLPYIVGEQEFAGRAFHVTPATLIPRPETEYLAEAVGKYLQAQGAQRNQDELSLADLGTGSGALAVTLALEVPGARVLATDISAAALEVAARNARRHGVEGRVELALSDASWLAPLRGRTFSAIVSNPPYIAARDIEALQIEVRGFEPRAALDGGRPISRGGAPPPPRPWTAARTASTLTACSRSKPRSTWGQAASSRSKSGPRSGLRWRGSSREAAGKLKPRSSTSRASSACWWRGCERRALSSGGRCLFS